MEHSLEEFLFNFDLLHYLKSGAYSVLGTALIVVFFGVSALAKRYINSILAFIGIDYFQKRDEEIRNFVSDIVELKGHFKADIIQVFRTSNGKKYVADESVKNIKIKRINGKPIDAFPDVLEEDMFKELLELTLSNEWKYIPVNEIRSINRASRLLPILQKNEVEYIFCFRITDYKRLHEGTYGFIIFMWKNKPDFPDLFTRKLSAWLDSLNIAFITHVESLFLEKFMRTKI